MVLEKKEFNELVNGAFDYVNSIRKVPRRARYISVFDTNSIGLLPLSLK